MSNVSKTKIKTSQEFLKIPFKRIKKGPEVKCDYMLVFLFNNHKLYKSLKNVYCIVEIRL